MKYGFRPRTALDASPVVARAAAARTIPKQSPPRVTDAEQAIAVDAAWRRDVCKKISECVYDAREARRLSWRPSALPPPHDYRVTFNRGVERGRSIAFMGMARRLKGLLR